MLTAQFASTCEECGDPIEPGDPIRRIPSFAGWVHGSCPGGYPEQPRAGRARKAPEVCGVCFLEKPCAC